MFRNVNILIAYGAMIFIIAISNYLVLFPINDWLTWGAFSYPVSFLITELTNHFYGPKMAQRVVLVGFALGVFLSIWFATPRIAIASGSAFLIAQLLDIDIFNRFRSSIWWCAPLYASLAASVVDAVIFWCFWGEKDPLLDWALGDTFIKIMVDLAMLIPFRYAIRKSIRKNYMLKEELGEF